MRTDHPEFAREPADRYGVLSLVKADNVISEEKFPNVEPETYAAFYMQLALALDTGAPVPVDATEARNVIRLIELARESAARGCTLEVS